MVADAGCGRGGGLVDVHAGDGGAGRGGEGAADGVVEEEDAGGGGEVGVQEALGGWVVAFADGGVVGEVEGGVGVGVGGGAGQVREGGEGVGVEVVGAFVPADVVDGDEVLGVGEVALGLAEGWRFDVVEGGAAVGRWGIEF